MAVPSNKPKTVALVKWRSKKGVEKIQKEYQQAIEERDAELALLNDDLQAIKYENAGYQGEIHANDQLIER